MTTKTCQEFLMMSTETNSLRSKAFGWSSDSGAALYRAAFTRNETPEKVEAWRCNGSLRNVNDYPDSPLNALACGWKLFCKPENLSKPENDYTEWEWWFVREVEV